MTKTNTPPTIDDVLAKLQVELDGLEPLANTGHNGKSMPRLHRWRHSRGVSAKSRSRPRCWRGSDRSPREQEWLDQLTRLQGTKHDRHLPPMAQVDTVCEPPGAERLLWSAPRQIK